MFVVASGSHCCQKVAAHKTQSWFLLLALHPALRPCSPACPAALAGCQGHEPGRASPSSSNKGKNDRTCISLMCVSQVTAVNHVPTKPADELPDPLLSCQPAQIAHHSNTACGGDHCCWFDMLSKPNTPQHSMHCCGGQTSFLRWANLISAVGKPHFCGVQKA